LCVTFRLTPADYGSGVRLVGWALWPVKLITGVAVVALLGGLGSVFLGYAPLAIALFGVTLGYAAILGWILYARPGQAFRRRADLQGNQTWCFSDREVSMTLVIGDSRINWSYFSGLLEAKDLYVLRHPVRQMGTIIPKRAFTNPGAEAQFRQFAQRIAQGTQPPTLSTTGKAPV
jgi:hypothetical protein